MHEAVKGAARHRAVNVPPFAGAQLVLKILVLFPWLNWGLGTKCFSIGLGFSFGRVGSFLCSKVTVKGKCYKCLE